MSAFVLSQENINLLTQATHAVFQLNSLYPTAYHLEAATTALLGHYADDLHNLYRALYIANIKAVNGRYREDTKTLPKYKPLDRWDVEHLPVHDLRRAAGMFQCYLYQCAEEPIYKSPVYDAFYDVFKALCTVYVKHAVDWDGTSRF